MKKLLHFLLSASLRQRVYEFDDIMDAEAFAVYFGGFVEPVKDKYIVTI